MFLEFRELLGLVPSHFAFTSTSFISTMHLAMVSTEKMSYLLISVCRSAPLSITVLLGLTGLVLSALAFFQKLVPKVGSPRRVKAREMPNKSQEEDRKKVMSGTTSAKRIKSPKKPSDTAKKAEKVLPETSTCRENGIDIPLSEHSHEFKKLVAEELVRTGKARVIKKDCQNQNQQSRFKYFHEHVNRRNNFFKTGRSFSFDDLITIPTFTRMETNRKRVFQSFWMTTDENFEIVKQIETENAKKELIKKEKEKNEAVAKAKITSAA